MVALVQDYGLHAPVHEPVYEGAGVRVHVAGDISVSAAQEVALGPTGTATQLPAVGVWVVAPHGLQAPAGVPLGYTFPFQEFLQPHLQGRLAQKLAGLPGGRDQLVGVDVDRGEPPRLPTDEVSRRTLGERADLLAPLLLDGRRGGEDDGGFVEAPDQLQSHYGLTRARRRHDVVLALGLQGLNLVQDLALILPERVAKL
jgi:hypothetical protein